ncbi:MAG: glycosyltransferase family 2 protein, partial [Bacteroidota bacterium]
LDSILAQTEIDWELLAINDYSTDNSWSILQQYASKDERIRIFNNTAKGIIPALRLAFAKSRGNYITRMDADDRMATDKLHLLKSALQQKSKGWLATGYVQYFSDGQLGEGYRRYQDWLNAFGESNGHFREIYRECVIPSPCWMLYREDLIRCGAFEADTYPEDYDLVFRFYESGLKITTVLQVLHYWRDHASRSSRNDPNYANQSYLDLKVPWFLKLDYDEKRTLVLWGAGRKAKTIA